MGKNGTKSLQGVFYITSEADAGLLDYPAIADLDSLLAC